MEKTLTGKDKSAFKTDIFKPFHPYYYSPYVSTLWHYLLNFHKVGAPYYMRSDAFMAHYKNYDEVVENLKEPELLWHKIMAEYVASEAFQQINKITAGSTELSIAAAYSFLSKLLRRYSRKEDMDRAASIKLDIHGNPPPLGKMDNNDYRAFDKAFSFPYGNDSLLREVIRNVSEEVVKEIKEAKEAKETMESAIAQLPGGMGFSHEALSVLHFLENPDDFRKRLKILSSLLKCLKVYTSSIPASYAKEIMVSNHGGIADIGVMESLEQLFDLDILETMYPKKLLALRLLSQQSSVYQRAIAIRPVVFIDKSGSMAEYLEGDVPKISAAAGLGLALYTKLHADVYLFDVEVHKVSPREIIKTLLTIEADSGTRIEEVLNTIRRLPKDRVCIVISDGIDEVNEDLAKEVARSHRVTFCLIPPSWERDWLEHFRVVKVNSIKDLLPSKILK